MPSTERRSRIARALFALGLLALSTLAGAHSVSSPMAFHGGKAAAVGAFHLELRVADGRLELYVYDKHNAPLWADSVTASARLTVANEQHEFKLAPRRRNLLAAEIPFEAAAVGDVEITLADDSGRSSTIVFPSVRPESGP